MDKSDIGGLTFQVSTFLLSKVCHNISRSIFQALLKISIHVKNNTPSKAQGFVHMNPAQRRRNSLAALTNSHSSPAGNGKLSLSSCKPIMLFGFTHLSLYRYKFNYSMADAFETAGNTLYLPF
jgi:hypothetical protein